MAANHSTCLPESGQVPTTPINGRPRNEVQPNAWYHDGAWRCIWPGDAEHAHQVRAMLVRGSLYPTRPEDNAQLIVNCRAALQDIVAELDPTDVCALYQLARLLAIAPREDVIFETIAQGDAEFVIRWTKRM